MGRKKKVQQPKEEIAEDLCFFCKDGGLLHICDYRNCLKAYHPKCVGNDQSILESEKQWCCGWHSCFICKKGSAYKCLCCPMSVCERCMIHGLDEVEFVTIRNKKTGLCINCLKLGVMIEENADVDSDGEKVDFQDRATSEFLFKDYWDFVQEKEGLSLQELHAARDRLRKGVLCESGSESDKDEVLEEESVDEIEDGRRRKRSAMKTPVKRSRAKKDFCWNPTHDSEEGEIDEGEMKLSAKRSRAKRTFLSWGVDDNLEESESQKKYQRIRADLGKRNELHCSKGKIAHHPKSEYAAIIDNNINPVYLRKSLVLRLLDDPETFEYKVTGCFVKVKPDPKDYYSLLDQQWQLGQIKGVKKLPQTYNIGGVSTDIALCINITHIKDTQISLLSNDDIKEEDLEDLRQRVKKGILKRPTIAELEKKIRCMHKEIKSHWIGMEITTLKKQIDKANDKGWRGELMVLIEKYELLRTSKERERLLEEIPSVTADIEDELAAAPETNPTKVEGVHGVVLDAPVQNFEGVHAVVLEAPLEKVGGIHAVVTEASVQKVEGNGASYETSPVPPDTKLHKPDINGLSSKSISDTKVHKPVIDVSSSKSISGEPHTPLKAIESSSKSLDTKLHKPDIHGPSSKSISGEPHTLLNAIGSSSKSISGNGATNEPRQVPSDTNLHKHGINGLSSKSISGEPHTPLNANGSSSKSILDAKLQKPIIHGSSSKSISGEPHTPLNAIGSSSKSIFGNGASNETRQVPSGEFQHLPHLRLNIKGELTEEHEIFDAAVIKRRQSGMNKLGSEIEIVCLDDDDEDDDIDTDGAGLTNSSMPTVCLENQRVWHYRDPNGMVHGPFTVEELRFWHQKGYFQEVSNFKVWRSDKSETEAIILDVLLSDPSLLE